MVIFEMASVVDSDFVFRKKRKNQDVESAMEVPWNLHESDMLQKMRLKSSKKNQSTTETNFLDPFFQSTLADCTQVRLGCESAMKLQWNYHDFDVLGLKESVLNLQWIRHESDM